MTRNALLVSAVCLLLLGGAWLASRALTADVAPPPAAVSTTAPVLARPPEVAAPQPVLVVPVIAAAPAPTPLPVAAPPPPPAPEEGASEQEQENTAAIEQAWSLVKAKESGPANWQRAERAFRRCLSQTPDDERCKSGLTSARRRIEALR